MIDDEPLNAAMLEAVAPLMQAAHGYWPTPSVTSDEFLSSPLVVRQAVLVTIGISRVHLGDPVRALLREVSDAVRGDDMQVWRGLASRRVTHGVFADGIVAARREVPITPIRCEHPGRCRTVVSQRHPLPPLGEVRCPRHRAESESAA